MPKEGVTFWPIHPATAFTASLIPVALSDHLNLKHKDCEKQEVKLKLLAQYICSSSNKLEPSYHCHSKFHNVFAIGLR